LPTQKGFLREIALTIRNPHCRVIVVSRVERVLQLNAQFQTLFLSDTRNLAKAQIPDGIARQAAAMRIQVTLF
jgi:hypothetical protein